MKYQYNIMGTSIYLTCLCPNLVSVRFYALPIFPFKFPIYLSPIIFFLTLVHAFCYFAVYLVANVLAGSLRLSNIFIATSIVCVLYYTNFTFSGAFVFAK